MNEDGDYVSDELQCPKCGSPITVEATCPTYKGNNGMRMRCFPACGNATQYDCMNFPTCEWFYIEGIIEGDPGWDKSLSNGKPEPITHEFPLDFKQP